MRNIVIVLTALLAAACSSGDGDTGEASVEACSADGQKQFVLDRMREWYFWNDLLPAEVDLDQFATPEELLAFLTTFSPDLTPDDGIDNPVDRFSFINAAAAEQAFFGEGKFEGFGFGSKFEGNDLRLTRVFADSPANRAGLARGQQILALNGRTIADIVAEEGVAGVSALFDLSPLEFTMREVDGAEFTAEITKDIVTIDPVPQARIITDPNRVRPPVGYMELATFISTADAEMDAVFADFLAQDVYDIILDLRYNGGGLVTTAELLGDFLASELVINGMEPHVEVTIVGDDTFGKPVGQVGVEFCEKILRPTAFQTLNADDFGDFFFGLPVDCAAPDDLSVAVGADDDPNIEVALTYLGTGACPPVSVPAAQMKLEATPPSPRLELKGTPAREFANAL